MPPEFPLYQYSPPSFGEYIKHTWNSLFSIQLPIAAIGQPAPLFSLYDPRSKSTETLESYQGKTVALKFCATWCTPCQFELRDWIQFHRDYWRENLVIIGVYMDREADMLSYIRRNKVPFTCCAYTSKICWDYGVYPSGKIPHTTIINSSGLIAWQEPNYHPGNIYESGFKPLLGPK